MGLTQLLPDPRPDVGLEEAFAFAEDTVRAVFIASVDGAATLSGRAGGLANAWDRSVFALHRALADVILVGAGTARTEGYGPAEDDPAWRSIRTGRGATAPIALVSHGLGLDFDSPLFAEAPGSARTIVITPASAPDHALERASAVAEVIVAGETTVDLPAAIRALRERGLRRIVCEGGPRLFTDLLRAGEVDEVCLTRSPSLVAGYETGILHGAEFPEPLDLDLVRAFATDDSFLYLLYRRARTRGA
ncbi:riboflavin biosynthesis pyrimidine reductase [Brevibacterium sanguinis]|uniref:Riboflavin biosynthesis pyrimidine reductase n=2 Tax=Brevibacterium TaxID=1696 RepID=A0A366IPH3_9MICO|nr:MULTISPECIES: dihydrofolate reductase family protein [Brevibacterium]RBP67284.1 riboflavin biosynthesis pyrimidine reductase [Brevibacterium sanguinis]RBP73809.1 riboflavin biosynthesis pyrimidine reductase [Brevibacterium celere]